MSGYLHKAGNLRRRVDKLLGGMQEIECFTDEATAIEWLSVRADTQSIAVLFEDLAPGEVPPPMKPIRGLIYPTRVLHDKQREVLRAIENGALHSLVYGGSRSGKTFLLIWWLIKRCLMARGSRHIAFRQSFSHIRRSIALDTLPSVMAKAFPGIGYALDKSDWVVRFPHNLSECWLAGLDDKQRTDRILGTEYSTLLLSEANLLPYDSVLKAFSRLAQNAGLPLASVADCNPTTKTNWTFKLYVQKVAPDTGQPLANPHRYVAIQQNPKDNPLLQKEYLEILEGMSARQRRRFLDGEFGQGEDDANLFRQDWLQYATVFDPNRLPEDQPRDALRLEELQRIIVSIDPSAGGSDESGIIAVGSRDGEFYVLADESGRFSPRQWAERAIKLHDDLNADSIIAEQNFGGSMVKQTIQNAAVDMFRRGARSSPNIRVIETHSSRGKMIRAEPVASLYEAGKVFHCSEFDALEDQILGFRFDFDRKKDSSPDRLDALVFALTELANLKNAPRQFFFATVALSSEASFATAARKRRDATIRDSVNKPKQQAEAEVSPYGQAERIVAPKLRRVAG